jgi:5-amino-6-(5-phosphoribosylamino)uracil reductase
MQILNELKQSSREIDILHHNLFGFIIKLPVMKLIHISAAMSLDGRINDRSNERLILSSQEDLDDMYAARANCDAILIGANTIRKDNPSLLINSPELVYARVKRGQAPELIKVTITQSGDLDAQANFFTAGNAQKFIICTQASSAIVQQKLSTVAKILPIQSINAKSIIKVLEEVGIKSLFIEGGTAVLTMFLSQGIFHQLRLAIAPFFVGDKLAPALIDNAQFQNNDKSRLRIKSVRLLGNMAVMDILNEDYVID